MRTAYLICTTGAALMVIALAIAELTGHEATTADFMRILVFTGLAIALKPGGAR